MSYQHHYPYGPVSPDGRYYYTTTMQRSGSGASTGTSASDFYSGGGMQESPYTEYPGSDEDPGPSKKRRGSEKEKKYACLFKDCTKSFARSADLDRHMQQVHGCSQKEHRCDYPKCQRHQKPFHRLDHYRDHLRDYHKEDLMKRNKSGLPDGCRVDPGWWRCSNSKCLARVYVEEYGWECPCCQQPCERARVELRLGA